MTEPFKVIDAFQCRIRKTVDQYSELLLAVQGKVREATLKSMLAEQCVMSLTVMWEAFVHELVLAYAGQDTGPCFKSIRGRMRQSLTDRFGSAVVCVRFAFPKKISADRLARMLDPKGFNITVRNADELAARANELLGAKNAKKFSLLSEDRDFLQCLIGMRNYLGHKSRKARDELAAAISNASGHAANSEIAGKFSSAAFYLKAEIKNKTRAHIIGERLIELSEKFK